MSKASLHQTQRINFTCYSIKVCVQFPFTLDQMSEGMNQIVFIRENEGFHFSVLKCDKVPHFSVKWDYNIYDFYFHAFNWVIIVQLLYTLATLFFFVKFHICQFLSWKKKEKHFNICWIDVLVKQINAHAGSMRSPQGFFSIFKFLFKFLI